MVSAVPRDIILVTGGARSGKSKYAERRARELGDRLIYIATAQAKDKEMMQRIAEHRKRRDNAWMTIEEPIELPGALLRQRGRTDCAVVDCLTLWISNLLLDGDAQMVRERVEQLVKALPRLDFHIVLVTNELGWGIVPDNALARQFRDLAGEANQRIAAAANEVVLTVTGIPMIVKKLAPCL
jgi:adenosylcobinamide kinase/adenosylcobinamide-phosphate guanylyltransferase